jgi:hypothetical protein
MQSAGFQFNRRMRERIFSAWAVLSLAIWLFMAVAEIHPPLHAWLHGGTIPDNDDDCAIVAIAHGKVETVPVDAPALNPLTGIEIIQLAEVSVFIPAEKNLPNDRAPPALLAVS